MFVDVLTQIAHWTQWAKNPKIHIEHIWPVTTKSRNACRIFFNFLFFQTPSVFWSTVLFSKTLDTKRGQEIRLCLSLIIIIFFTALCIELCIVFVIKLLPVTKTHDLPILRSVIYESRLLNVPNHKITINCHTD